MAASTPSRRLSMLFGCSSTVLFSRIATAIGLAAICARGGVEDVKHFFDRMSCRFRARPAGQLFGDHVQVGDPAGDITAHDRIADGVERDFRALLFLEQGLGVRRPIDHVGEGLRQQVVVEPFFQQVVLGARSEPPAWRALRAPALHNTRIGICGAAANIRSKVSSPWLSGRNSSTSIAAKGISRGSPAVRRCSAPAQVLTQTTSAHATDVFESAVRTVSSVTPSSWTRRMLR